MKGKPGHLPSVAFVNRVFLNGKEPISACLIVQHQIFAFVLRSSCGDGNLGEIPARSCFGLWLHGQFWNASPGIF